MITFPENWIEYEFGEFAEFNSKISLKKGTHYPFVPMENLNANLKYVSAFETKEYSGGGAKFCNGDTLFARITPCLENGKIAQVKKLAGEKGFGSTEYFIFRGRKNVSDTDFIFYLSKTDWFQQNAINSMVGASGRQRADAGFVSKTKLNLPPLTTQKKIAAILSTYDDLIENNLKRIKLLEEMAQITYEEWFVRLKFPGHETASMNLETGLPVGWVTIKVGNFLAKIETTTKIKSTEYCADGKYPIIDQGREYIAGYTNDEDSIIDIGRPIIVFGDHTRILKFVNFPFARGADGTQILLSKDERMPQHLFYFSLLAVDLSNYHYARHFKFLKDCEIILPDLNTAQAFENVAAKNFVLIKNLRNQNQLLKEACDILLPRLMTGMIDVDTVGADLSA
ncbi:MAG: restriction endonuclease subunit S [Methylococcaceae bacterium]|nr:restriction endonuclease subunit S [Methylococcaceae bacterium]MDP3904338.1 restriction endonuclease subunit S [Methylococcaceae bacterium]